MFEVKLLVEDNKLHKVMWALDGLVAEMFPPIPVRGAKATASGVVSTVQNGTLIDAVIAKLQNMGSTISYIPLRALYSEVGGNASATGSLLDRLIQRKVIKRTGKGTYTILGPGIKTSLGPKKKQGRTNAMPISGSYLASLDRDNIVAKAAKLIKEQSIALLSLEDLGTLAVEVGGSKTSNYFLRGQLIQHGILQPTEDGNYQVVG